MHRWLSRAASWLLAVQVVVVLAGLAFSAPAHAAPSVYCADKAATISRGGSVTFDVSNCDGPSNVGVTVGGTQPSHGVVAYPGQAAGGVEYITYTHNGDAATSDVFQTEDEDGNFVTFTITIVQNTPTVTAVSPTSGPSNGGNSVVLTGTNFAGATAVNFGGTAATGFTVNSATQITATAPAGTGTVNIRVTTPDGTSATAAANQYAYVAAPVVNAVSPASGPTAGGTTVILTGQQFANATAVTFGGTAATSFTVNSATQITATAPAGTGTVNIRVTTAGGTSATSAANQYTYVGAPTVSAIAPTGGSSGGGTPVTITGTNFVSNNTYTATFGATTVPATYASATTLTATAPAGAGTVQVTVVNTTTSQAGTGSASYSYAAPTVTGLSASAGPAGQPRAVTISGTNFTPTATVSIDGTAATSVTYLSATQLTATLPAKSAGSYQVQVTTGSVTSAANPPASQYTYIAAPTITAITPNSGSTAGGTAVTVSGSNLSGATAVTFSGAAATNVVVAGDGQSLTATTPANAAGASTVAVTTPGGTGQLVGGYTYVALAAPSVTTQPQNQTVAAGSSATFSVSGSGTPSPTIEWQVSTSGGAYATIPGATGASYTTPATTAADNGNAYRAVLTNSQGTATTSAAILTVVSQPTANDQSVTTPYQTATAITLTGADPNTPARTLTYTVATSAVHGALSGTAPNLTYTPNAGYSGSDSFTFTVSNGVATSAPATVSITVSPAAPTVTTQPSNQTVTAGAAATFSAGATGSPTVQWQISVNGGGSWSDIGGATSTSYTTPATTTADSGQRFRAVFSNAGGVTTTTAASLTVVAPTITIAPASLPNGTVGVAYSQTVSASGGAAPYTYAVTAGALPAGMTLNASGSLSGTPTAGGIFNFTVTATDSSTGGSAPFSGSRAYTFTVAAATVTVAPTTLPTGSAGTAYSQSLSASGGTAPYSYAVTAGALPTGLTLSAVGLLTGTPTAGGSFTFTVTATDSSTGSGPYSGARSYTVTIAASTVVLTPATLPAATTGSAYSQTLSASGGVAPYRYAVAAGTLPAGVTLASNGVLSGTPTTGGTFNFTAIATDSATGSGPYSGSRGYTLTVSAPTLSLSPSSLPGGQAGVAYSQTLTASGGAPPYSYAVTAGVLPTGLTLNAATGVIDGAPTAPGSYSFTITAVDSSAGGQATVARSYSVVIAQPTITVDTTSLPAATVGGAYSQTLSASGGFAPYRFAVTAGALPAGLSLSSAGGLSGSPTQGGSFAFTVTATDASGAPGPYSGSRTLTLTVGAPSIAITPATLPNGQIQTAYSQALSASGGTAPYAYAVTAGALPTGVTLSFAGVISGTPTVSGSFNVSITATDASGGAGPYAGTQAYVLVIAAPNPPVVGSLTATVAYGSTNNPITAVLSGGTADSVAVASGPSHGSVSVNGLGFVYTPVSNYVGADSFTYTATNAGGVSAPATVSITVTAPPPPTVTPPAPVVVPPANGGGSAPVSVALGARTQGVTDGYRVTTNARFGSSVIAITPATTPQGGDTFALVYTPAANFIGTDTVDVVAYGPGGDSAPATFTFQVAGKAPDLSGSVASSGTLTVSPTATLVGGPFQALRIIRQPAFGAATVQGLNIVFTPGVANGGSTSLDYVIDLPFGSSAAGRIDLTVGRVPASQTLVADTIQGRPVTVRISNAAGGPFTGAAVVSVSPTTAGSAAISGTGGTYDLTFTPQGDFSGQAVIRFTLTNASGTSTGTLTVTVAARPDPSLDPDVRGVASGQITAARRFSDTQVDNFQRRLEGLRNGANGSQNGLSLNFGSGDQDDRDPRVALRRQLGQDQRLDPGALGDDRERDMLGLGFGSDRNASVDQAATQTGRLNVAPISQGATEGDRSVGVWTSGSVDWGRQDAQGLRDSRFTTQGVTAGLDVRLNDRLIVGGGLGYGEDKTRIGDNGSTSTGKATTGALYASWRPADGWFVDGVVGRSRLDFDSRRWVVGLLGQANGYADGDRSGDIRFASATVGRTLRRQGLAADLYVRMEGRDIALDGFTETSGGLSALTWDALDQSGLSVNLGASWRWSLASRRFGALRPTARLEWSHELEDIETQGVRYADWAASPTYLVPLDGWSRDALNLDLGAEWSLSDRLMLSLGYRGMLGDASTSHGGLIGLKYGW
ncbi:putative Ig domain-containing protein [uncultured Brevundimonas sp.]|uniref:putative Ig domain-containing protein n=1 Tax=uncultured Brevundimonas sp. TaxID=213418 RepID=UPI0025F7380C|nr:putative Ig domain-containing protein [uncultured Brevundimonas sp.]